MKTLKRLALSIIIILGLFFIIPLFLPGTFDINRSMEIKQSPAYCLQTIADMSHRQAWDPWLAMEKDLTVTTHTTPNIIGSTYYWQGDTIGEGNMLIDSLIPFQHIYSTLRFTAPQQMTAQVIWDIKESKNNTHLTWHLKGSLSYPLERWLGLFMDKQLGKDFNNGLKKLKEYIQTSPLESHLSDIHTEQKEATIWLGITDTIPSKYLQQEVSELFNQLITQMQQQKQSTNTPPVAIYHSYTKNGTTILTAAFQKENNKATITPPLKTIKTTNFRSLSGIHHGSYEKISLSYSYLSTYAANQKISLTGEAWEIYLTNPQLEQNQANWKTQILFPIKEE